MKGWKDKVLRVNLSSGKITKESLPVELAQKYVGGRGLASKYLLDEIDPLVDPFSPSNKIIFATGPLTGTSISCGARYMVVTKGPLTGAIACSNSGGHWGPELKFAGYDMLIVEGKSEKPCYISIIDDEVEIRSAENLWGRSTWEVEDAIKAEVGDSDARIASIGLAGEKLVRYACVINDKHRAAGRSGVGAVMGSKNLKAIAVRGTGPVEIADGKSFLNAVVNFKAKIKENPVTGQGLPAYGTDILMNVINEHGALPTRNFLQSQFEGAEALSGEKLAQSFLVANKACFACTIGCGRVSKIKDAKYPNAGEGPEYESAYGLGAICGISDLSAVIKANFICNELGLDTISAGAAVAMAMEAFEKGYIGLRETEIPLSFGSSEALLTMLERIGKREGLGDILAEGSKRAADKFNHPELFMGVKGQDFAAYDPRGIQGMGLTYATSNRGACHLRSYTVGSEILGIPEKTDPFSTQGKWDLVKIYQDLTALVDSTGVCLFVTFGVTLDDLLPALNAATGSNFTAEGLMETGERIWNLEKLFNIKAGFKKEDDNLPERLLEQGVPAGPTKGMVNRLIEMLSEYYRARGWDSEGVPTESKLQNLGL